MTGRAGNSMREAFRSKVVPRLIALAFLAAFAASIITLIYTGLNVRGRGEAADATEAEATEAEARLEQPREGAGAAPP